MQERIYDERSIQIFYVPRDLYYKNYKKAMAPPTLPASNTPAPANPIPILTMLPGSSSTTIATSQVASK